MRAFGDRAQHVADEFVVVHLRLLERRAFGHEFLDVGPRGECLVARTAQHDTAHCVVRGQLAQRARELAPHRDGERVEFAGIVDRDGGDIAGARQIYGCHG